MNETGVAALVLILINLAFTYQGLRNTLFLDQYKFEVDKILINKDYKRLVTSGFLHVGWMHFIFNMYTLYAFSGGIETYLGLWSFIVIYFSSLIGGNLFALFVHRNHDDYSAVGASGAISGIVFASIALFPGMELSMILIPIYIPAWLFGLLYVLYTIYGVRSKRDNIGHEAHLGGGILGMLVALLIDPEALKTNTFTILIIALPAIAFILFVLWKPQMLFIDNFFFKSHDLHDSIDHRYNKEKALKQQEIDAILDKINNKGINSLSAGERKKLDDYSQR